MSEIDAVLYEYVKSIHVIYTDLFCFQASTALCILYQPMPIPSNGVMSSPFLHKTVFFSEFFSGDLLLNVAIKLNLKSS